MDRAGLIQELTTLYQHLLAGHPGQLKTREIRIYGKTG
jgi:hypothetical protein